MEVERAAALSNSPGARRGQVPLRTTLSQSPLKSCGFPGAESARKRFFLRGASPHSEKISARGRPTEIFDFAWSVAKRLACPLGKQPFRRAGRRPRLEVERVHTLSSSPGGCSFEKLISDDASCSFEGFCFRRHGRGALRSPTPPWATGCERAGDTLALSRGLVWRGVWFPTMQGCSFDGIRFRRCGNCSLEVFRSRRRGRGALRSPAPPRATGARGL